VLLNKESNRTL